MNGQFLTETNVLNIGAELRQVREACGLSLNCVGKQLTVNPNYISRVERGEHLPGLFTLVRLADAYGLAVALVKKEDSE